MDQLQKEKALVSHQEMEKNLNPIKIVLNEIFKM